MNQSNTAPKEHHVFMSYSRKDAAMMRRVTEDLRAKRFKIWTDEQLEPGTDSWKSAIQTAIENSHVVVVLLSPDAKKSEWVERELDYARAFQVPIIPVLVRGDIPTAVPFLLISEQHADLRHDYQAGLHALQDGLCYTLKLPDLCADHMEASPAPNQADLSTPAAPAVPIPGQPKQFAGKLRIWKPLDYVRLVGLYLFDPVRFYTYDPRASRALAVWLTSTLFWLPLAINVLAYGLSEVPLWGFAQEPLVVLPAWLTPVAWLLTGLLGQVHFEVQTGIRAFLRGPLQFVMVVVGLATALLYGGSVIHAQPVLETRSGLVYLLASQSQQLLIIAGGLSVFAGAIFANNLARGVASWLGIWMTTGFLVLFGLVLYLPVGETLTPLFPADTSETDITARGMVAFSSVVCCLGGLLLVTATTVGKALRQRQVGRFNFLLPVLLIASYGIFVWVHVIGGV
jgi:hypothetical protein